MTLDRKTFFSAVRADLFGGFLTQLQVDGIGRILDEAERRGIGDPRILAYRFATVFHETGRAMIPVREAGGEAYLKAKPYYPWVGMGLVQVTWEENGRKFGAAKPEDLMAWPVALKALFDGMDGGVFTGRKVGDYFTATVNDPINARRVINGRDRAEIVAGYHYKFLAALKAASAAPLQVALVDNATAALDATGASLSRAVPKPPVAPAVTVRPTAPAEALPASRPGILARTRAAWARFTGKVA